MHNSRVVVGAGGTGKTYQLRTWVAEIEAVDPPTVVWLSGAPTKPLTADQVAGALSRAPELLIADDLQWFDEEALQVVLAATAEQPVLAGRRPGTGTAYSTELLDAIDEALSREHPIERLGLLDLDRFAAVLVALHGEHDEHARAGSAMASEEVAAIHHLSGGSPGLAADIVSVSWDRATPNPPAELVDAVQRRIRRSGPETELLVSLWSAARAIEPLASDLADVALKTLPDDVDESRAERSARAGGLIGTDSQLIPLVERAALADLPLADRAVLHDRLAMTLAAGDPLRAARQIRVGAGGHPDGHRLLAGAALQLGSSDPQEAAEMIDRAEQLGLPAVDAALVRGVNAFHLGSPDALGHLDRAVQDSDEPDERASLLGYGLDLRDLRFGPAAARPLAGELAGPLSRMARTLDGQVDLGDPEQTRTPIGRVVTTMSAGLTALTNGDIGVSLGAFTAAADDFDRLRPSTPFGITPHGLGALAGVLIGDVAAVDLLCSRALEQDSGGPGERLTHELIRAYGSLVIGDYRHALAALRAYTAAPDEASNDAETAGAESPGDHLLSQRDRLLLAALEAGIARRSGDTGRLRNAWSRAEQVLLRQSASWLFMDFFTELLACGARLGDHHRVDPVVESLTGQGMALPATGPGPVAAHWLRLQVAIAAEDADAVDDAAVQMAALPATDRRSKARQEAAEAWRKVFSDKAEEAHIINVAAELSSIGEGWEASRLLGQAALDEDDPQAARRLLELARVSTADQIDDSGGDGLVDLGLSDREAEVAVLVAEGRTHKEIGAQLFISPKTVEHHVAKIRQKLGATTRAEMLSLIREALD